MRTGSTKGNNARKVLSFYRVNFGYEPPYRVLLDPDMVQTSISNNLFIKHTLPNLLNAAASVVVTSCVVRTLREAGESHSSASLFAKRATRIPCTHEGKWSASDCIKSRMITPFEFKLILASNDPSLIADLMSTPGVPLISIVNNTKLVLRPPTKLTLHYVRQSQSAGERALSSSDKALIEGIRAHGNHPEDPSRSVRKRKRAKAPNPLSVKKSKKSTKPPADSSSVTNAPQTEERLASTKSSVPCGNTGNGQELKDSHTSLAQNPDCSTSKPTGVSKQGRKRKRIRTRRKANTAVGNEDLGEDHPKLVANGAEIDDADLSPRRKLRKTVHGQHCAKISTVSLPKCVEKDPEEVPVNPRSKNRDKAPQKGARDSDDFQQNAGKAGTKEFPVHLEPLLKNDKNEVSVATNVFKPIATKIPADSTPVDKTDSVENSAGVKESLCKDTNSLLPRKITSPKAVRDLEADKDHESRDGTPVETGSFPFKVGPKTGPEQPDARKGAAEKMAVDTVKGNGDTKAPRKKQRKNRRRRPKKGDEGS